MEKQKHTPGPWEIRTTGALGYHIASINDLMDVVSDSPSENYDVANARLIAAAPELLGACRKVEAYLQGIRTGNEFQEADLVAMVQAAIAKATTDKD